MLSTHLVTVSTQASPTCSKLVSLAVAVLSWVSCVSTSQSTIHKFPTSALFLSNPFQWWTISILTLGIRKLPLMPVRLDLEETLRFGKLLWINIVITVLTWQTTTAGHSLNWIGQQNTLRHSSKQTLWKQILISRRRWMEVITCTLQASIMPLAWCIKTWLCLDLVRAMQTALPTTKLCLIQIAHFTETTQTKANLP